MVCVIFVLQRIGNFRNIQFGHLLRNFISFLTMTALSMQLLANPLCEIGRRGMCMMYQLKIYHSCDCIVTIGFMIVNLKFYDCKLVTIGFQMNYQIA